MKAQPIQNRTLPPALMLGLALLLSLALLTAALIFWNFEDRGGPLPKRSRARILHQLRIRSVSVLTNLPVGGLAPVWHPGTGLRSPRPQTQPATRPSQPPPVPYLDTRERLPYPEQSLISSDFLTGLVQQAQEELSAVGVPTFAAYVPSPDEPGVFIPAPSQPDMVDARLELLLQVEPATDSVWFQVGGRLSRPLYFSPNSSAPEVLPVASWSRSAVRVRKEHLQSAIRFEIQQLIRLELLPAYQADNP